MATISRYLVWASFARLASCAQRASASFAAIATSGSAPPAVTPW
jgi:hypothetical protein